MIQRQQDKGKVDIQNQSQYAPLYFSLGYNCVSSLSELIQLIGPQIQQAVEGILQSLLPQLNLISIVYTGQIPKAAQSYDQEYGINTAMSHVMAVAECISLIALIFPSPTVQTLNNQKFIEQWIVSLRSKCEKTDIIHVQSVRGICAAIKAEPAVMCQNFNQLLQLLLSIVPGRLMYGNNQVKNAVLEEVKGVLIGLRDAMVQQPAQQATGSLWGQYAGALGDSYKQVLEKIYGIPSQ
ncbi:MAG: hypothetical protein EZS28_013086 [Streblomastix strix]|uniref:Uncharacterized protein n=1 Tax=Streblomastix strix TaxID=222440 RepID=A0A5J4W9R2_9EUKA|nr:MAG: hypothetical protein EZS28_013086 [Streblomastix strix]